MKAIWERITPPLRHEDIVRLAVGPKKARDLSFSDWETILSEIIVGDAFGVDPNGLSAARILTTSASHSVGEQAKRVEQ